jgi:hypothetical protein
MIHTCQNNTEYLRGALKLQVKDQRAKGGPRLKLLRQDTNRSGRARNMLRERTYNFYIYEIKLITSLGILQQIGLLIICGLMLAVFSPSSSILRKNNARIRRY